MVVLLICLGIGAVWMTAALPNTRQQATREKEAELVFRGRQYVRALSLYERRNGPGTKPSSIDVLVDNRFLRKKYKDPMTGEDFVPLFTSSAPAIPGPGQQAAPGRSGQAGSPSSGTTSGGQIIGVVSKSTAASIMVFSGATHYNEWQFVYQGSAAGGGQGGRGGPGGRGGTTGSGTTGGGIGPGTGGGQGRGGASGRQQGPGRGGAQPPAPTGGAGRGRGGL